MTHLPARDADASITLLPDAPAPLPSTRYLMDGVAGVSHDRVMTDGGAMEFGAVSASLEHTMIGSWCLACDPAARWQSDPRPPTLHYSAISFEATGGITVHDAVPVKPFNPDITPNERSGR